MQQRVAVVGAGMAGAACAAVLNGAGVPVDVIERGRAPGGRMAAPRLHGRRVDLGAAYLTVRDDGFRALVDDWCGRGLARAWTDTFEVLSPDGRDTTSGPQRYATAGGLRSLVRDVLPVEARLGTQITALDDLDHDVVVLAMPDPQAARLAPEACEWVDFEPVITVAAGWAERGWDLASAAFVNDDPDITLIADDGSRRGDGAPVLVAHTTGDRARRHLDDPQAAVPAVRTALHRLLGVTDEPAWTYAHRWTFAKPVGTHGDAPFGLGEYRGRLLGLATDTWCPEGPPRIESAWLAGTRLGRELVNRLG